MIKLLILCLLAPLLTMETETPTTLKSEPTSPETSAEPVTTPEHNITSHHHTAHELNTTQEQRTTSSPAPLTCNCTTCTNSQCTAKAAKRFCVTTAEENTLGGSLSSGEDRSCADNVDSCNVKITITLSKEFYWRSRTTCCNHTNCNSGSLDAPSADTTLSKLECPSCFGFNQPSCTPHPMKCAVSETKCISVAGTVKNGSHTTEFVGKGCASASANQIKKGTILLFRNTTYNFTSSTMKDATDGASQTPRSVPFIFFLSSFVGLLQAKFIY